MSEEKKVTDEGLTAAEQDELLLRAQIEDHEKQARHLLDAGVEKEAIRCSRIASWLQLAHMHILQERAHRRFVRQRDEGDAAELEREIRQFEDAVEGASDEDNIQDQVNVLNWLRELARHRDGPIERWGVGAKDKAKAFATATVRGQKVELIHGQYPHSRKDNNTYARYDDGYIEPFSGHRHQIKIVVETGNYLKESHLSGDEVRKSASCEIFIDGFMVYAFGGRDPEPLLRRAADEILIKLYEHNVAWWDPEERAKVVGRKVYYQNTPATVLYVFYDQGCVVLKPEEGLRFPKEPWMDEMDAEECRDEAKIDFFDPRIWWYRDE